MGLPQSVGYVKKFRCTFSYRWFLGLSLEDKVPDHSSFSVVLKSFVFQQPENTLAKLIPRQTFLS
jgi:hypothetical protein